MSAVKKLPKDAVAYGNTKEVLGKNIQMASDIKWPKYHKKLHENFERAKEKFEKGQQEFKATQIEKMIVKKPRTPDFEGLAADKSEEGMQKFLDITVAYANQKAAYKAWSELTSEQKNAKKTKNKQDLAAAKKELDKLQVKLEEAEKSIDDLEGELHKLGKLFETEHKFKDLKQKVEYAARCLWSLANKATSSYQGNVVHYAKHPYLFHSKKIIVAVEVEKLQELVDEANQSIEALECNFEKEAIPYDAKSIKKYCEAQGKTLDGEDADVKLEEGVYKYVDKGGNWKKVADKVEWSYEQNPYTVKPQGDAVAELSQSLIPPTQTDDDEDDDIAESPSAAASGASGASAASGASSKKRTRAGSASAASSSKKGRTNK